MKGKGRKKSTGKRKMMRESRSKIKEKKRR